MDYALCINGGGSLYVPSVIMSNSFLTRRAVSLQKITFKFCRCSLYCFRIFSLPLLLIWNIWTVNG